MDHKELKELERAINKGQFEQVRIAIAMLFLLGVMLYTFATQGWNTDPMLVFAAMVGGYMALNIGANDVANNVGPAVGSRAITLGGALFLAAIFEMAGAIIAGGEVVGTIRNGIINPEMIADPQTFVFIMTAALIAGALWLNIATALGAPVSTSHSIVGAVVGAGIAAAGTDIVDWQKMGSIAASWVISPVLGGIIAAAFLIFIKRRITYQADMVQAARNIVPWLVALMVLTFSVYLLQKGVKAVISISLLHSFLIGLGLSIAVYLIMRHRLNTPTVAIVGKSGVNSLFTAPLIFAAALLSFAHGSNDVANAIGPLAAIVDVYSSADGLVHDKAAIPMWVMWVGAIGIALGLALFGPKVIRTIGSEITELDQMRAYCIAMSATITVIVASQLGLPVSSTHIAVGGVFGVGFLREHLKKRYQNMVNEIKAHHPENDQAAIDAFMADFTAANIQTKGKMLQDLKARAKANEDPAHFSKGERKGLKRVYRQQLVKRSQLLRIAAAWVITVPATALIAALAFFMLVGMTE